MYSLHLNNNLVTLQNYNGCLCAFWSAGIGYDNKNLTI